MLKHKLLDPVLSFLKQGVSASALAWAVAVGVVLAVIPVFGVTTVLCLLAVWLFRLNPVVVLTANQVAWPLQFVLFIPFMQAGAWAFGGSSIDLSFEKMAALFENDFWTGAALLWWSTLRALLIWSICSVPVAFILQAIFRKFLSRLLQKMDVGRASKPEESMLQ